MKSKFLLFHVLPLTLLLSGPFLYSSDATKAVAPVAAKQESASPKEITSVEEFEASLVPGKPKFYKIYADWCGACKVSEEPFKKASQNNKDVLAYTVNSDNAKVRKALEKKFDIQVKELPTLLLVSQDEQVRKEVGSRDEGQFEGLFSTLSYNTNKENTKPVVTAKIKDIKNQDDLDAAFSSGRAFVIEAWADWCGACKASKEPLARAHEKYADSVDVYMLNADDKEARKAFKNKFGDNLGNLPTFAFVSKDGKNHCLKMGSHTFEQFVPLFASLAAGKNHQMTPLSKVAVKQQHAPKKTTKRAPAEPAKPAQSAKRVKIEIPGEKTSKDIKNQDDLDAALNSGRPFIIKVWAEWCGACTMSDEPFARAHAEYKDAVDAYSLNFDSPKARAALEKKFDAVSGLPTLVLVSSSGTSQKELGSRNYNQFVQMFKKLAQENSAPAQTKATAVPVVVKSPVKPSKKRPNFFADSPKRSFKSFKGDTVIDDMELDTLLDEDDVLDELDAADDQDLD